MCYLAPCVCKTRLPVPWPRPQEIKQSFFPLSQIHLSPLTLSCGKCQRRAESFLQDIGSGAHCTKSRVRRAGCSLLAECNPPAEA